MKRLFVTGVPVTGNDFVGRNEELKAIGHSLQNGQSVVVIAPSPVMGDVGAFVALCNEFKPSEVRSRG